MVQRPSQKARNELPRKLLEFALVSFSGLSKVWIGTCEGANTCLMPGGDGLPEGAMFRNEDGKRFFFVTSFNKINRGILKIRSEMHAKSIMM